MVLDAAFRSRRARVVVDARVDTLGVDALSVARTVAVGGATDHATSFQGISAVAAATATFGAVLVDKTFGVDSARIFNETRVDAVAIDARFSRFAFGVDSATHLTTCYVRITLVTFFAGTNRSVVLDIASRMRATVTRVAT